MAKLFKRLLGIPTFAYPQRYEYQIQKMVATTQSKGFAKLFEYQQQGIPLFNFNFDVDNLAIALSTDIRKERYTLSPPTQRLIQTKTKKRIIYDYPLTDKIIIATVSQLLNELLEKVISVDSYAFRSGNNPYKVVSKLSEYMRKKRLSFPAGLYLYKTDIVAYSDNMHVAPNSVLWKYIKELMDNHDIKPSKYQEQLITQIIRPEYYNFDDCLQCNAYGAPTGSAIITFVNNLYTYKIDKLFDTQDNLFYARYCDDILMIHPDPEILLRHAEILNEEIRAIQLKTNPLKDTKAYFSTSGAGSSNPAFEFLNYIDYLGYRISANGGFSLSKPRQRKFIRLMIKRIEDLLKTTHYRSIDEAGIIICHSLNHYMTDKLVSEQSVHALIKESSDHSQLKHIDYILALEVAKALTRKNSVKAFREVSYQKIREQYGLNSLIMLRNEASS